MVARNNPNEIYLTRVYDAPLQTVWDAWTDPDQVAQWWGPRGFTLTTHSKDLRPGGIWHYTMHGPDGVDYPNKTLYHEVEVCKKLVYDHGATDERQPLFRVTVLFSESDGKTTMEMTMGFPTAEQAEASRKMIKEVGGNSTWDRLAEFLDETEYGRHSFVVNRSFDAPVDFVFEMWTDCDHLAEWLPAADFEMECLRGSIEAGESLFYKMWNPAGVTMYSRFEYKEIVKPCRIVFSQSFCDENEQPGNHPGLPVWPASVTTTVIFETEYDDATRVTLITEPCSEATAQEIAAFLNLRPSMTIGWSGSLDKLEAIFATVAEEK